MTKVEFEHATVDGSEPVRMDYAVPIGSMPPSIDCGKEVMRITGDGVWVDPCLTTDEAARAVIASLDEHIKHLFTKKDAAMRRVLELLGPQAPECCGCAAEWNASIAALEDVLK